MWLILCSNPAEKKSQTNFTGIRVAIGVNKKTINKYLELLELIIKERATIDAKIAIFARDYDRIELMGTVKKGGAPQFWIPPGVTSSPERALDLPPSLRFASN